MIFHKYQLIFVGIPKNGSTSVCETLTPNDSTTRSHATLKKLLNDNPNINNYYRAAIKRNPYIRAISAYTMMPGKCKTFKEKIKQVFDQHISFIPTNLFTVQSSSSIIDYYYEHKMESVFIPQYYYMTLNNKIELNEILCLENIENDWYNFASKFEGMPTTLKLENKTSVRDCDNEWQSHYDSESIEIVNYLYKHDFEVLNYQMLNPLSLPW